MKNKTTKKSKINRHKFNNKCRFCIDFFEFCFLVEACIPPRPIARSMFWDDVINKHYYNLTSDERKRLFEWICKNPAFDLKNEDCFLFYSRFNPENQYKIKTLYEGKAEITECFKLGDQYHTEKNRFICNDYIVEITKLTI